MSVSMPVSDRPSMTESPSSACRMRVPAAALSPEYAGLQLHDVCQLPLPERVRRIEAGKLTRTAQRAAADMHRLLHLPDLQQHTAVKDFAQDLFTLDPAILRLQCQKLLCKPQDPRVQVPRLAQLAAPLPDGREPGSVFDPVLQQCRIIRRRRDQLLGKRIARFESGDRSGAVAAGDVGRLPRLASAYPCSSCQVELPGASCTRRSAAWRYSVIGTTASSGAHVCQCV